MTKITTTILVILGIAFLAPAFAASDPNLNAIKARQSVMQLRAFNAGPLFAMAKGKVEYDSAFATKLANNLKNIESIDIGHAWIKGTDNKAYPGKSEALPEIWSTYPAISKKGKAYAKAVNELAAVAGDGLEVLKGKVRALGNGCKGCHDDFREKKN